MRTLAQAGRVLGALEDRVMEVFWHAGPLAVRDVCRRLKSKSPLAYTTVMTTSDRLYKKGLLTREKSGNAFIYRAAMTRDEFHRRIVKETVSGLIETSGDPVLAAFVDAAATVDEENLDRLERIIAQRRRSSK